MRREAFIAEGRLIVGKLLAAPRFRVRSALGTASALASLRGGLEQAGVPVYVARPETLQRIVGFHFHRGCLAAGERRAELGLDVLLQPRGRRILVALEGVTNPDNVGGVFRNAMAFGADGVVLGPGCADPLYRRALRVSMGGALETPFATVFDWPEGFARLRAAAFTIAALTPDRAAADISAFGEVPERLLLLLGSEGEGLSAAARAAADVHVRIPMAPGVDSLNVATAAGIALHRLARVEH